MKKKVWIFSAGLLLSAVFCSCAEGDLLEEVPKDYAIAAAEAPKERGQRETTVSDGSPEEQEAVFSFLDERASVYAYNSLTDLERIWYRDMEEILGTFGAEKKLSRACLESGLGESDIDRIFQCVLNDHPELFYVEGYSYVKYTRGAKITSIVFSGSYTMDFDTAVERKAEIEAAADEILAQVDEDASDYDKVKYVYETLIRDTEYQLNAPDNQNIYSVFINHTSVCQGYAKATQYLLDRLGIDCSLVLGTVDTGEVHAWNLVKIDGSYYYVDTTWGDASYQVNGGGEETSDYCLPEINYDYLCVTTAELLRTHTLSDQLPMPVCDSTENNYYVREGALFMEYDREQMKELFRKAREQGRKDVTVKCTDIACYRELISALIDGQEIFDYLSESGGSVAYVQNDNQLSLTFWVTNE
ncbi:MAG: hypothetical protein K2P59_01155 [Acetatifactor sp.]|nr:hypothetical protein [Acetatifactor sp.]